MVDEFIDVNCGEKQFMKVWNLYMMENKLVIIIIYCKNYFNSLLQDYGWQTNATSLFDIC